MFFCWHLDDIVEVNAYEYIDDPGGRVFPYAFDPDIRYIRFCEAFSPRTILCRHIYGSKFLIENVKHLYS